MTTYALNIADSTRFSEVVRGMVIVPVIAGRRTVNADAKQLDGAAIVLECDEARAAAIVDVLRGIDERAHRYPTRAYTQGARGAWTAI